LISGRCPKANAISDAAKTSFKAIAVSPIRIKASLNCSSRGLQNGGVVRENFSPYDAELSVGRDTFCSVASVTRSTLAVVSFHIWHNKEELSTPARLHTLNRLHVVETNVII
jgi:hypothetical protein